MSHTFKDGALLVNLIQGDHDDRMTAGRCYRVMNTYDGHSGSGQSQEWVRVADNRGVVVGFDPARFIEADRERVANPVALSTATRMLRRTLKMSKGLGANEMLASLHSSLKDQVEDAQSIIAVTALDPLPDQIIFDEDKAEPYDYNCPRWNIVCAGSKLATLTGLSGRGQRSGMPVYHLDFQGKSVELNAMNFDAAHAEVADILTQDRRGGDFTQWATSQWLAKIDREAIAAKAG